MYPEQPSQALQPDEMFFQAIIEKNADGIIILDKDGIVRFVNPAAEVLLGQKAKDIIGELFSFTVAIDQSSEIDIVSGRDRRIAEMRTIEIKWQETQVYLTTLRDITSRKKAENKLKTLADKLKTSNKKMETLLENMLEGVIMFDKQDNLVVLNFQARQMLGFKEQAKISAQKFYDAFPSLKLDRDMDNTADDEGRCCAIVKEITMPEDKVTQKKEARTLRCEIIPVAAGKKILGVSIVLRDITREKKIEHMKSEFISTVSHELRTPLASIKNAVNVVLDKSAGEINKDQTRFLSMANRNVDRLTFIIDDLLDISKIEAGRLQIQFSEVDLNHPVDTVLSSLMEQSKDKSITLYKDVPPDLPHINADPDRLIQILFNLIGNAIKFTPNGGKICIAAREEKKGKSEDVSQQQDAESGDRLVEITVSDTGAGIPPDEIESIFERFHRVPNAIRGKVWGTGLGLPIVKRLVEMHHGSIRVESKMRKGSNFIFTIPVFSQKSILRFQLDDEIKRAKEKGTTVSLIIIKINFMNGFKRPRGKNGSINIFNSIKNIVKNTLRRDNDKILTYSEMEQMLAVVIEATKHNAYSLCNRIKEVLDGQNFVLGGKPITPSSKMYVAEYPEDSDNGNDLITKVMAGL